LTLSYFNGQESFYIFSTQRAITTSQVLSNGLTSLRVTFQMQVLPLANASKPDLDCGSPPAARMAKSIFLPLLLSAIWRLSHLLAECPVTRQVWDATSSWTSIPGFKPHHWSSDASMFDWFSALAGASSSTRAKGARSLSILVCSTIWRERNARVFEGQEKSTARLITKIKDEAALWVRAGARHLIPLVSPIVSD
jgi:hypothetical protein